MLKSKAYLADVFDELPERHRLLVERLLVRGAIGVQNGPVAQHIGVELEQACTCSLVT